MVLVENESTNDSGVRKSRGRGLRTKTGCVTCRRRHLKCDETRPVCRNCKKKGKTCLYQNEAAETATRATTPSAARLDADEATFDRGADNAFYHLALQHAQHGEQRRDAEQDTAISILEVPSDQHAPDLTSPTSVGTSSLNQPIGVATARWFDMLAEDADIELEPTNRTEPSYVNEDAIDPGRSYSSSSHLSQPLGQYNGNAGRSSETTRATNDPRTPQITLPQIFPWRCIDTLDLQGHEQALLARFTTHISEWIDLFDPRKHFSALVPRLALHNVGLMNAILALSARHNSVALEHGLGERRYAIDEALKYYHETLHYVRTAMQYTSYHTSLELLATTLIISAYEMLDGSSRDWQRHLQGVFWIQRSQTIHGDSGGLQGAVWWAWLCQDIWAAFRGKRKVFTFWKPEKKFHDLEPTSLASRSVFLLGRVINYCAGEDSNADLSATISARLQQARTLATMMDEWESCLTPEFTPLPYCGAQQNSFSKPIWIHPPIFASAMQMYHASRLLVCLHQPSLGGFHESAKRQTSLIKHISAICGIALTLTDYASSTASSMCLFIAGMSTTGHQRRDEILSLLRTCRTRTGWPVRPLDEELIASWQESDHG